MKSGNDLQFVVTSPLAIIGGRDRRTGTSAGVVDRPVESAEACERGGDELIELLSVRDVGLRTQCVLAQQHLGAREPFLVTTAHRDQRALGHETLR